MTRRLLVILAACSALLGISAVPLASAAKAEVVHIPSNPGPVGLLRVCVIVHAADAGLCIHI